ncbi:MAG: serine/threonine protein kinase, partial [Roseibacillus sp.]|nr:serine/threonine protein kinase [Roseibacillus sp.]
MKRVIYGTFALLVFTAIANAEWFQFRGPGGQGVSVAKNVPLEWGLKKGVAWKKKLPGKGWSSPVIGEGKIVITVSRQEGEKVSLGV